MRSSVPRRGRCREPETGTGELRGTSVSLDDPGEDEQPGEGHTAGAGVLMMKPNLAGSSSESSRGTKKYSAPAGARVTRSRTCSPRTVKPCGTSFGSAAYEPASTSIFSSPT